MCVTPYSSQWGSVLGRECQNKSISEHLRRAQLLWRLAREVTDQKLTRKEPITHQGTPQRNWSDPSENTMTGSGRWLCRGQEEHQAERLESTPSFRAQNSLRSNLWLTVAFSWRQPSLPEHMNRMASGAHRSLCIPSQGQCTEHLPCARLPRFPALLLQPPEGDSH